MPARDRRLRVAVVGCGKVTQNMHLPALAKSSRCELVAVCDVSRAVAQAVADRYGIDRVYTDLAQVLEDDRIDAVLVAVGDPLHVPITLQVLGARKHVLIEKPLGVSAAECEPLREAVKQAGVILQVGVMKRCDPGLEYARRAISNLGHILSFSLWYRASADPYVDEDAAFLPVLRDPAYQRPAYKLDRQPYYLATHGAHLFDNVLYLVGDPEAVQAGVAIHAGTFAWQGLLRYGGDTIGSFELAVYVESEWSEGIEVFGERGSVHVSTPNPFYLRPSTVRVFDASTRGWHEPYFTQGDPYLRQIDAFAASVLDGDPVVADVSDGIAALELLEAVAASAASSGQPTPVRRG